jgi:hypothetical protein
LSTEPLAKARMQLIAGEVTGTVHRLVELVVSHHSSGLDLQLQHAPALLSPITSYQGGRVVTTLAGSEEVAMTGDPEQANWDVVEWHGKMLLDRDGEKIGKLQDVYVDVETDEPQFGTVKEGFIGRHLTFVPLGGVQIGPDALQVQVTKEQVRTAPDLAMHGEELSQADESALYHHFELNYTPPSTASGRRLARR